MQNCAPSGRAIESTLVASNLITSTKTYMASPLSCLLVVAQL